MYSRLKVNPFLLIVIFIALSLRIYAISYNPPSLNWDEVSHGYNAYSILKTGKDEWGITLPTIFRAYGDYKLPVYIYATTISEAIFGLTPFAVRLVSVISGILTVLFTYLLVRRLFNEKVAIISSFLVAVEPWSFFLSRGAFEANLALTLIVSGIYLFIRGLKEDRLFLISSLLLGLSVWTYNSARIFVPLFLLALILVYREELVKILKNRARIIHYSLFIILFFFLPMLHQLVSPLGQARYGEVAILDKGAIAEINELRVNSKYAPLISRLVYNKVTYFSVSFVGNYFSHFSIDFLFLKGGTNFQFSLPNFGLLYLIDLPFFILGLILLVRERRKEALVILSWFLLAPIADSLTREAPHVLRAIVILPMPMVIASVGVVRVLRAVSKNLQTMFVIAYLILVCVFAKQYLTSYFTSYRTDYSWSWQYGYKEVVDYAKDNYAKYDKIIVTKKYGEPHEFFLFFWPWDPIKYRNDSNLVRFYQSNWYWVDRFDKFYFVNDWQIPKEGKTFVLESKGKVDCISSKCLLITSPGNYPKGWRKLETINFLDGKGAFEIYENF